MYHKDEFGRFVSLPIGPVVSAVDNNVFPMQAFPAVQDVVSVASGVPVGHHVPSMENTGQPYTYAAPVISMVSTAPVLPAQPYQFVGPLESCRQLPATGPASVLPWNRLPTPSSDVTGKIQPGFISHLSPGNRSLGWYLYSQWRIQEGVGGG